MQEATSVSCVNVGFVQSSCSLGNKEHGRYSCDDRIMLDDDDKDIGAGATICERSEPYTSDHQEVDDSNLLIVVMAEPDEEMLSAETVLQRLISLSQSETIKSCTGSPEVTTSNQNLDELHSEQFETLKKHSKKHAALDVQTNGFNCPHCCDSSFSSRTALSLHLRSHLGCKYCKKTCCVLKELYNHYAIEHPEQRPFHCSHCGANLKTRSGYQRHEKTHKSAGFYCTSCNGFYKTKETLRRHTETHHSTGFHCTSCNSKHKTKESLKHQLA